MRDPCGKKFFREHGNQRYLTSYAPKAKIGQSWGSREVKDGPPRESSTAPPSALKRITRSSFRGANTGKGVMEDANMRDQGISDPFETLLGLSFPEVSTKQHAKI